MENEVGLEVVDKKTGEVIEQTPEGLLLAARDAAQALERVIDLNDKPPLMFNGRRYLEIHHWQTIGKFYGCSVRTGESEPCEIAGVQGFKAKAELVNDKTGAIVGGAVAYCMRDESSWKTKPIYALASMAQTRAGSKALSNKFRFVAIVAGYEGCSAEEVTDDMKGHGPQSAVLMPRSKSEIEAVATPKGHDGPRKLTEEETAALKPPVSKFFAALHATVRKNKVPEDKMKAKIKELFNKDSSKDLTDMECSMLIKAVENGSIK